MNLFRGEVNTPLTLVNLSGRNGLSVTVTAFYASSVWQAARTWNQSAPTGLLGLGWSLGTDRIVVDDKGTGNPLDGDYYLQVAGLLDRLEWCGEADGELLFQCRQYPLWQVRYAMAAETWRITREDGSVATYGDPAAEGSVMYGVAWGNWIGASRRATDNLRRYAVSWNLSEVRSVWGDRIAWRYDNEEVEVAGGLTYTRASYVRDITDAFDRTVTFGYVPKERSEYVPPHQNAAGEPDPAFQDRYETRALDSLQVRAGDGEDGLLYTTRLDYELINASGHDGEEFTKRILRGIRRERDGRPTGPPVRLDYARDPAAPNAGGMTSMLFSEGGLTTFRYRQITLTGSGEEFKKNITVPNPVPGSRPLVFNGPGYVVIAWYSQTQAVTVVQVYSFGGRWSQPWSAELPGRIRPERAIAAMSGDFFALYLSDTAASSEAVIHVFQQARGRFGEWVQRRLTAPRRAQEIPAETVLRAGDRFVVLHVGGDPLVHRFWYNPITETWERAEHGRGTTRVAIAAYRNYYIVAWYDTVNGTAPYQIFHRDLTGTWSAGPVGAAGQRFEWDPFYAQAYWAVSGSFAVATYLSAADALPRLRMLAWEADFSVARDEVLPGKSVVSSVVGSTVGNGPLVLRFDGMVWKTFEFGVGTGTPLFAYGDDLAVLSLVQGSGATNTVAAYDATTARWRIVSTTAEETAPEEAPEEETPEEETPASIEQVWPPSIGGAVITIADQTFWREPDGELSLVGTLPVSGAKRSLCNRGPTYLAFEDQPANPTSTTTSVLLFANGEISQTVTFPGQRIATDDPIVSTAQLAGASAFVTYPGGQSIARPTELYLHRILDQSLADEVEVPVVDRAVVDNGYQAEVTEYDYDAASAVLDPTGQVVQFPRAIRISGAGGSGGRSEYSFYNGLPEDRMPALRRTSRAVLRAAGPDYSLLTGMVREAIVFDADGFEVSASHSVWSTLPLDRGPDSPLGVLLPVNVAKLTRSTVITGGLRLFDLPGALAADFDAGVIPPQARELFFAHGLPLEPEATVEVLVPGERWAIVSAGSEYVIASRGQLLEVLGTSQEDIVNSYDPATGYLIGQETTYSGSSGGTEVIRRSQVPAWRVPEYLGIAQARMLTALASETLSNVIRQVTISATATTYRNDWPAPAPSAWAEYEAYTWLGQETSAPPFDYRRGADRPGWLRNQAYTARGRFGQPTVSVDVTGLAISTLFDAPGQHAVATLINVDLAAGGQAGGQAGRQGSYLGFEAYEDHQGWRRPGGEPLADLITDEDAHTGRAALRLPGAADGTPVQNEFALPAGAGRLLLACWVKTEQGFPAGNRAGWRIGLSQDGRAPTERFVEIPDTAGEWRRLWAYLDPPEPATPTTVTCRVFNSADGQPVLVDDVRVAPVEGGVVATVYDQPTFRSSAGLDVNNNAVFYFYDEFLRQIATADSGGNVVQLFGGAYSRRAGRDEFDPAEPNSQIAVAPAGPGFVEEFRDGSGWQARWEAEPPGGWAVADGALWHTADSPGSVTLRDSGDFACYGVRLDVRWPGQEPPAGSAGIHIGRISASWESPGEWLLRDGDTVVERAAAPVFQPASWLMIATDQAVVFFVNGRQVLSHWFSENVAGQLALTASEARLGFARVMVFHQPRLSVAYLDGCGVVLQQQRLGDHGTSVGGQVDDELGRPSLDTKTMLYADEPPGYRPRFVTGVDWGTGRMTGDLASYYSGGRHSDDDGYPYSRTRLETAETARPLELGQPGATLAIGAAASRTTRLTYGANVTDGFLDYLPAGRYPQVTLTDPDGAVTRRYTDQAGNIIGVRDMGSAGGGERTSFSYDARGALVTVYPPNYYAPPDGADPSQYVITRTVDGLGRLITSHSPDSGTTDYIYDQRGLLRFALTAVGRAVEPGAPDRVIYHRYDRLGRLKETGEVSVDWDRARLTALANTDWPVDAPDWRVRRVWDGDESSADAIGRLSAAACSPGPDQVPLELHFSYDPDGNVTRYVERHPGEEAWEAGYGYLGTGELAHIVYPHAPAAEPQAEPQAQAQAQAQAEADVVTYGYDLLGQLTQVGSPGSPDAYASYAYNAGGGLEREVLKLAGPEPLTRLYRVNSPGWPVSIDSERFSERISYWEEPGYDGERYYDGRVARLDYSQPPGPDYSWLLAYDRDGRLRTAQCTLSPQYGLGVREPAGYDANGNMLALDDGGTSRVFQYAPGTNRLLVVSPPGIGAYGYDRSGNVAQAPDPRRVRLQTDMVTGLTTAIASAEGTRLDLRYGMGIRRVSKRLLAADGSLLAARRYLFGAGDAPLAERLTGSGGDAEIRYIHGVGGLIGLVCGDVRAGVVKDRLSSARLLISDQGEVLGGYDYRPFCDAMGEVTGSRPGLLAYRFTGREWDEETGLYNFGARLYDPAVYRFYATDPAGPISSPYLLVSNDPLNLVDPDGEFAFIPLLIAIGIGALAGAIGGGVMAATSGSGPSEGRFWAYVGIGLGVGALAGALSYAAAAGVAAGLTAAGYTAATTTTSGFILSGVAAGAVGGTVDGVVTGGLTQLFGNLVDGKRGGAVWDGVETAMGWGALAGAAGGALSGGATGLMIRRGFRGRPAVINAHRDFSGDAAAMVARTGDNLFDMTLPPAGALGRATHGRPPAQLITHGDRANLGRNLWTEAYQPNQAAVHSRSVSGGELGDVLRGRFSSMELLACHPAREFAQQFASASRTVTRALPDTIVWDGVRHFGTNGVLGPRIPTGQWSAAAGTRMLTFYPNELLTAFVRLFGY